MSRHINAFRKASVAARKWRLIPAARSSGCNLVIPTSICSLIFGDLRCLFDEGGSVGGQTWSAFPHMVRERTEVEQYEATSHSSHDGVVGPRVR